MSSPDHWQALETLHLLEQVVRSSQLLGSRVQLLVVHRRDRADLRLDLALVTDGFDDVTGAWLALTVSRSASKHPGPQELMKLSESPHSRPDEGSTFADPSERLAEILRTAYKGCL